MIGVVVAFDFKIKSGCGFAKKMADKKAPNKKISITKPLIVNILHKTKAIQYST